MYEINTEIYLNKKNNVKREYRRNRYRSMSEDKKQKFKKYQKSYREANNSEKT